MKLNHLKSSYLSSIKYAVLLIIFALGYQFAGNSYPQTTAVAGWVLGFLIGLKLRMAFANKP